MKIILIAATTAVLSGCAGALMRVEADCQARYHAFVDVAACLKDNLRQGNAAAWAYVDAAQGLAAEVRSGRMSESEARSRLAAMKRANTAAAMDRLDRAMEERQRQLERRAEEARRMEEERRARRPLEFECRPTVLGNLECRQW